jgi:hypothetical protein
MTLCNLQLVSGRCCALPPLRGDGIGKGQAYCKLRVAISSFVSRDEEVVSSIDWDCADSFETMQVTTALHSVRQRICMK